MAVLPAQSGFHVAVDFSQDTNDFFGAGNPSGLTGGNQARASLNAAANFFSTYLADDFDAITPVGTNSWDARINNPSGSGVLSLGNISVAANTVVIYAGGQSLGGDSLGQGGSGFFSVTGFSSWFDTVFRRGEMGATRTSENPTQPWESVAADESAPWGGAITFDSDGMADTLGNYNWHFDHTASPATGEIDFFSVALHEMAHSLGFGTADSWGAHVVGKVFERQFDGEAATAANGGVNPDLETNIEPSSHWIEGIESEVFLTDIIQEAGLDPVIFGGTRSLLTDLDMAGFSDMGWTVIPEPSLVALLGVGLAFSLRRRR
ncbi:MAG: PEP-CTERM sorting domain-containing protein [Roseibacillus sp.]